MNKLTYAILLTLLCCSCNQQKPVLPKQVRFPFSFGEVEVRQAIQNTSTKKELFLSTRFHLKDELNADQNQFMQYQLAQFMRLVVQGDTIAPVLSYYVPLIHDRMKEINCRFLFNEHTAALPKKLILLDRTTPFSQLSIQLQ